MEWLSGETTELLWCWCLRDEPPGPGIQACPVSTSVAVQPPVDKPCVVHGAPCSTACSSAVGRVDSDGKQGTCGQACEQTRP